ncbi:hypothetical protein OBBRIDRAFT_173682 [Obba rivulosa]|uniref:DUF6534 domain-containing protein n=1 Tax=Obba rivulosa TaxID=1052685 RepID=A0A8E2AV12_9APHY|nr:hypothetical protein OBBRIDRAFT_173682 [Obba rivulosa]
MAFTVRGLFCHRVWKLGRNWMVIAPIVMFATAEFGAFLPQIYLYFAKAVMRLVVGAIGENGRRTLHTCSPTVTAWTNLGNFDALSTISPVFYMSSSSAVIADVLIAMSQVLMLWSLRTGFKRTDSVMRTLMLYSINSGLLTSLAAASCLITFATMPQTLVYVVFYHLVSKLLLNSLLATYNARQELRITAINPGEFATFPLPRVPAPPVLDIRLIPNERPTESHIIHISVDTKTSSRTDSF